MDRFFFDIRDGDQLAVDEEGLILPDIETAQEETARALADMARDMVRGQPFRHMAIEVRNQDGPVLEASFLWRVQRKQ